MIYGGEGIVHPENSPMKRLRPNALQLTTYPRVKCVQRLRLCVSAHAMYQRECTCMWLCVRAFAIPSVACTRVHLRAPRSYGRPTALMTLQLRALGSLNRVDPVDDTFNHFRA